MRSTRRIIWGIVFIAIGLIFALNAFDITDISIFFEGWWTLFIIIPSIVGLFTDRDKFSSLFWLVIGALLLLWQQNVIDIGFAAELIWPAIIILLGLKLIFGNRYRDDFKRIRSEVKTEGGEIKEVNAVFGAQNIDCGCDVFQGAELNAVFGGIKYNLSNAVIQNDCVIEANAIFGGVEITLPSNVNVKINSNSAFGGTSDKTSRKETAGLPTVYINATGVFGGVTVL